MTSTLAIGEQIRQMRKSLGITQTALAKKIGSYQKTIVRIEKQQVLPSFALLQKIARAMGSDMLLSLRPQPKTKLLHKKTPKPLKPCKSASQKPLSQQKQATPAFDDTPNGDTALQLKADIRSIRDEILKKIQGLKK